MTCVEIRGDQASVAERLNRLTSRDVGQYALLSVDMPRTDQDDVVCFRTLSQRNSFCGKLRSQSPKKSPCLRFFRVVLFKNAVCGF